MSWLSNIVRPKISALVAPKKEIPDNLWHKCAGCGEMLFHRDYEKHNNVCHHCGHHGRIRAQQRLEILFDNAEFDMLDAPTVPLDPLKFRDKKRYTDRIKDARDKTKLDDVLQSGIGLIGGKSAVVSAFDFSFMGGSMGTAVGEGFVNAAQHALDTRSAFIVVPASGGARMQESILSLMQMARTTAAIQPLREAGLPYIVLLSDPTTGGVTASFAMIGDVTISEPGALICFAGARVIEETIREKLPEGFQRAEYLYEHGMIDRIVKRDDLNKDIGKILNTLMNK